MLYVKVQHDFYLHPRFLDVNMAARGLWITLLAWCGSTQTDGFIPAKMIRKLGGSKSQVNQLLDAGILEPVADGYQIYNYLKYQTSSERIDQRKAVDRERKRLARAVDNPSQPVDKLVDKAPVESYPQGESVQNDVNSVFNLSQNQCSILVQNEQQFEHESYSGNSVYQPIVDNVRSDPSCARVQTIELRTKNYKGGGDIGYLNSSAREASSPPFFDFENFPPEPPACERHHGIPAGQRPSCWACAEQRKLWERQKEVAAQQAKLRQQERRKLIEQCPLCDPNGWRPGENGLVRCDHTPQKTGLEAP